MKQVNRTLAGIVVAGVLGLTGVGVGAEKPQFRESITVQGAVGGVAGEHHLTFSGPVALPGVSLAPGTYIFRRPAANVLQVANAKRVPYAMLITSSAARTGRTDRYEIVLGAPAANGSPRRIEAWFAPGESTGQALIYRPSNR
jgi:hypothetical protein